MFSLRSSKIMLEVVSANNYFIALFSHQCTLAYMFHIFFLKPLILVIRHTLYDGVSFCLGRLVSAVILTYPMCRKWVWGL